MNFATSHRYLPPEWHTQAATLIAWPQTSADWDGVYDALIDTYCALARAISQRSQLIIVCPDADTQVSVESRLPDLNIQFSIAPTDDIWIRDNGPISVTDKTNRVTLLNFAFNGWGNKYPHQHDNALTQNLHQQGILGDHPLQSISFILEGGSIDVDGQGTLLTTTKCLLNPNRNPQLTQTDIEHQLAQHLGIKKFLWLTEGELIGDDTDAHIDTLARFISPTQIVHASCDDPNHPNYPSLKRMEAELATFTNHDNQPYQLIPLPIPKPIFNKDNQPLPATYANFLMLNGAILMPTYDDPADEIAASIFSTHLPDFEVINVPCRPLIHQFGSLHCATMQLHG